MDFRSLSLFVLCLLACPAAEAAPGGRPDRAAASRFLSSLDPALAGRAGRPAVEAHARAAGLRLACLGPGWFAAFLRGRYRNPAPAPAAAVDGVYVGENRDWVWFALPLGPRGSRTCTVWRDGVTVPACDVRCEPAPDGRAVLVYLRNTGDFCWGALVTAVGTDGKAHSARRKPDDLDLTCETRVARGRERTRITARPRVRRAGEGGDGKATARGEGTGPRPAVRVKDDTGFFASLFRSLGRMGFSLAVTTAAGLILTAATAPKCSNVHVNPADGSVEMEVPTEAYDRARVDAGAGGVPIAAEGVARALGPVVVMESRAATGRGKPGGLHVVRAWSGGGSLFALRPGQAVAFSVRGWSAPPTPARASVVLLEDGTVAGFLAVRSVGEPDPGGACTVEAVLPAFTSTLSGDLEAEVRCAGLRSNRVPLGLSPARVEVTVLQPVVRPGSRVKVLLRNPSGGPVRGTVRLAGPGRFAATGGCACAVDRSGPQAVVHVRAVAAGRIDVTFEPTKGH